MPILTRSYSWPPIMQAPVALASPTPSNANGDGGAAAVVPETAATELARQEAIMGSTVFARDGRHGRRLAGVVGMLVHEQPTFGAA